MHYPYYLCYQQLSILTAASVPAHPHCLSSCTPLTSAAIAVGSVNLYSTNPGSN